MTGYHAHIDLARIGWTVVALIQVSCYGPHCVLLDPTVVQWPEVREIHRVTGDACSVLKVATDSMEALERVIERLAQYGQPSSRMILSTPLGWCPVTAAGTDT